MIRVQVTRPIGYAVTDSKGKLIEKNRHWPFPAKLLDYPTAPPNGKPAPRPQNPPTDEPAPF